MHIAYLFFFVCLTAGPILIAWIKGDRILDSLARRRRIRGQLKRRRGTRALPIKSDILNALLTAEENRDRIEEQISHSLVRFRNLPDHRAPAAERDDVLEHTAQLLLTRESRFSDYLDLAWLQSETIEVLTREIDALRKIANVGKDALKPTAVSGPAAGSAAKQLLANLDAAASRRETVDRKLRDILPARESDDQSARFDATVE
jgi:hypothetical protein